MGATHKEKKNFLSRVCVCLISVLYVYVCAENNLKEAARVGLSSKKWNYHLELLFSAHFRPLAAPGKFSQSPWEKEFGRIRSILLVLQEEAMSRKETKYF